MDKLELNESLRIYLPGLYFMAVINYLLGLEVSGADYAVLAIFAGLLFNSFALAESFFSSYIEKRHGDNWWPEWAKHKMFEQRKQVFLYRFEQISARKAIINYLKECEEDTYNAEGNVLSQSLRAFDAGRHHVMENKQMRLLSTFGHLKYSLALISFAACGFQLLQINGYLFRIARFKSIFGSDYRNLDCVLFGVAGCILFYGAIRSKQSSLKFENRLYRNYSNEELARLGNLIEYELDVKERCAGQITNQ